MLQELHCSGESSWVAQRIVVEWPCANSGIDPTNSPLTLSLPVSHLGILLTIRATATEVRVVHMLLEQLRLREDQLLQTFFRQVVQLLFESERLLCNRLNIQTQNLCNYPLSVLLLHIRILLNFPLQYETQVQTLTFSQTPLIKSFRTPALSLSGKSNLISPTESTANVAN